MSWIVCLFCILVVLPQTTDDPVEAVDPSQAESLAISESADEEAHYHLKDMVVTATRTRKKPIDVPASIDLLDRDDLRKRQLARTVPEALKEVPGVMVQKTSHGQGSPYIRGFTGFRTLFMIDGIRLNNSVFRDGPNQYWNTVDPMMIDRMEVVKGPSSVLYGSDAIGGTVNALTRDRHTFGDGFSGDGNLHYRYSSAERAHTGRLELNASLDHDLAVMLGGTFKSFGDVRAGNSVGLQRKTGYDEWDADFKVAYYLDADSRIELAHQRIDQDDAWRSHKTIYGISWEGTSVGSDLERSFEQNRELTYARYINENPVSFIERLIATVSYQHQEEERFRIKSSGSQERQGFDVGTQGFALQVESATQVGRLTYGAEYYRDSVESFKRSYTASGTLSSVEIQGPVADESTYDLLGIYLQDDVALNDRLDMILGGRYTYAGVDADRMEDPLTGSVTDLSDHWDSVVGSLRFLYGLDEGEQWKVFTGVSQGFRAPNLSDLTRLDTARSDEFETPSPDLDPEYFTSYEVGLKTEHPDWSGQVAYYYTDIRDMIVRTPTGNVLDPVSGNIIPDPDDGTPRDAEVTKKNAGQGFVHGLELGGSYRFHPRFTAFTGFSWMYGEADTYPTSAARKESDLIDRLMPPMGHLGLRWNPESDFCWLEGICAFANKADKLSERDKSDTQRIPPGGTPGYTVFHLRSGWKVLEDLTLSAAVENIFNEDYRIHGSGQNEPGRGLVLGVNWAF